MEQRVVKTIWDVFALFWRGRDRFRATYHRFKQKEDRLRKRLRAETLLSLYEEIGIGELQALRDENIAPTLERLRTVVPDTSLEVIPSLTGNLSVIYHRLSLLIEYYVGLKEGRGKEGADQPREALLRYMEEIHRLMRTSERLFEDLAASLKDESLVIRSLYLHWQAISPNRDTLRLIYKKMYEGGMCEGLIAVAEDFLRSGFYMRAREAAEKALLRLRAMKKGAHRERLQARARRLLEEIEKAISETIGGMEDGRKSV